MDNISGETKIRLDELKRYAAVSRLFGIGGVAFAAIGILLYVYARMQSIPRIINCIMTFSAVMIVLGAAALIFFIRSESKYKDSIEYIYDKNRLNKLIEDFKSGERFKNGLILGDEFVIGHQNGTVIFYKDIESIFVKDMTYKFVLRTGQILYANLHNGNKVPVCTFPMLGSYDVDSNMHMRIKQIIIDKASIR